MKMLLVVSILIGEIFKETFIVSRFEKTRVIHFFARALSVSGTTTTTTTRPFRSKQKSILPQEFLASTAAAARKSRNQITTRLEATTSSSTPSPTTIEWIPTRVEFDGVYRSYGPPTIWRKLTSSVPRREFALQDISLGFGKSDSRIDNSNHEDSLALLLGASSSGKSTIFRIPTRSSSSKKDFGRDENKGRIEIRQLPCREHTERTPKAKAIPILLDDRGEVNSSSGQAKTTLREAWNNRALELLLESTTTRSQKEAHDDFADALVDYLADAIFELDPERLVVDLTPSEKYRFCLGKACIESSLVGATTQIQSDATLPGPIILLDEWMDVETSAVVHKVQPSLHKIVEKLNGIVLSITHKPELYFRDSPSSTEGAPNLRRITLSGGKLLSDY
eukprot:CAMPEP_0116117106 /NCGR_PEP_ID=MMETSP0329-20121206/1392_1 /TAXON_ID=697910 /ORGANISM="Pseudo-nitzschia arenysensis, Strain B593" /LENGTH=392 /DNA_ID=CAMNT_0003610641 /DNA_START=158 /DNA_END=1335 /DNA_ORIENTATION=+